jgi:putative ABC transport system permease protein
VTAGQVISGPGLTGATLDRVRGLSGVRAAAGVTPVNVAVRDPDLYQDYGEAVAGGPLDQVLDLGVSAGRLTTLRPGQIAISALEAGPGEMGVHVGSRVTVYLPDGTPYRAAVTAIYDRSLAIGDVLIPASVTAGHTGTAAGFSQILVDGGTPGEFGAHVLGRDVANAQSAQAAAQNGFGNDLILGLIASLAAIALLNTLVVSTLERRRVLRLLGRVGATRRQLAAVFGWQAAFITVSGVIAGAAAGAVTLLAVTRAATGSWAPYVPFGPAAGLVAGVAVLTAGAILIPFRAMAGREPALSSR